MKYKLLVIFLLYAGYAYAMDSDKAEKMKALRAMGTIGQTGSLKSKTVSKELLLAQMGKKLKKQEEEMQKSLENAQRENAALYARFAGLVDRQTATISQLSSTMRALLKKDACVEAKMSEHDQEISELREAADRGVDNLLTAVGTQQDLIMRQTNVIKKLLAKMEKQEVMLKEQKAKSEGYNASIKKLEKLLADLRKITVGINTRLDGVAVQDLIRSCEQELARSDFSIVEEHSDTDVYRQVFGKSFLKENSDGTLSLRDDAPSEEIEQISVRLLKEPDPTADPFENEQPVDSDGENNSTEKEETVQRQRETIEEVVIIEDLSPESIKKYAEQHESN